jgi:hypothetical protein
VVAAVVDVAGKPGRANPDPEDDTAVSMLVIDLGARPPEEEELPSLTPPPLEWAFVACIPAATTFGPPICQDLITPCNGCVETPPEDALAFPVVGFQVPSESALEEDSASQVVVQGAICANGPPAEDSIIRFIQGETDDINPCEDPVNEGRFVTVVIPIEADPEDPNLHPAIADVELNGRSWPPPFDQGVPRTAPRTGCRQNLDALPPSAREQHPVAGDSPSTIDLLVTSDSLQTFTVDGVEDIEEIQVSWLSDGGGFDTAFSFITDPARSILTAWQPFQTAPDDGLLVRFSFVIRDGRGGTDFVQRGLCVLPPSGE